MTNKKYKILLLIIFLAALLWSAINPKDYFTWFLEVFPAVIGLIILIVIDKKFELTRLLYFLILLEGLILVIGGHYTYAEMPLFNWLKDVFDLGRNYYDRLGHLMQGLVPALIAREVLIRKNVLKPGAWLYFIVVCICLAISAFYEFIEWWVAVASGTAAEAFLGTQGDTWDTQWDMFMAFVGANLGLIFLSKLHDRYLTKLENK
ncbi:MAG: Inner membrane protein YjdF [Parcubacteria group bacterium ADurb.Bin316]|nr:MAG: Inner membrane protein YjdF [Parcubacteria group bacterium ADurb.Bin316]HOZ55774.1 DUF2238 domain-containing protein [bacterium]